MQKQSATLVNPTNKTLQTIACEQDSYSDIRAQFGANARVNPDCPNKEWVNLITAAEKKGHICPQKDSK
jgi:hypothetical protein